MAPILATRPFPRCRAIERDCLERRRNSPGGMASVAVAAAFARHLNTSPACLPRASCVSSTKPKNCRRALGPTRRSRELCCFGLHLPQLAASLTCGTVHPGGDSDFQHKFLFWEEDI